MAYMHLRYEYEGRIGTGTVDFAMRRARKAHVCEARDCDIPGRAILVNGVYLETPEGGRDPFHPKRYHITCGVRVWHLLYPTDGSWESAMLESAGAKAEPE